MDIKPIHPAALPVERLLAECEMQFGRRSGPGGQHRNKVETAVVLVHRPTGVRAEASERRSQSENREAALRRLRVNLAIQVRCPDGWTETPSELFRCRRQGMRLVVSDTHADFPAILAEVLDRITAAQGDVAVVAAALGCSGSQLVKLVTRDHRALELVNQWRSEAGLHALK